MAPKRKASIKACAAISETSKSKSGRIRKPQNAPQPLRKVPNPKTRNIFDTRSMNEILGMAKVQDFAGMTMSEQVLRRDIAHHKKLIEQNPQDSLGNAASYGEIQAMETLLKKNHSGTVEEKRVRALQQMLKTPGVNPGWAKNINAVIKDYQNGRICYQKGMGYYYYHGKLVVGPKRLENKWDWISEAVSKMESPNCKYHAWLERCGANSEATQYTYHCEIPPDLLGHHKYRIRIMACTNDRYEPSHIVDEWFCDDTGASTIAMFETEDYNKLAVPPSYAGHLGAVPVMTSMGVFLQSELLLSACLCTAAYNQDRIQDEYTSWQIVEVVFRPGSRQLPSGQCLERLGGPFLRNLMYVGNAPVQSSILPRANASENQRQSMYVTQTKTKLFERLPVRTEPFPAPI